MNKLISIVLLLASTAAFAGANPINLYCSNDFGKVVLFGTIPHDKDLASFEITDSSSLREVPDKYTDTQSNMLLVGGSLELGNLAFSINVQNSNLVEVALATIPSSNKIVTQDKFGLETNFDARINNVQDKNELAHCVGKYSK